jgi:hypothetical protein
MKTARSLLTKQPRGLKALIANLNTADPAFDEVRADVEKLLQPPPIPAKVRAKWNSPGAYWLRTVLNKIEEIGFDQNRRTILPLTKYHGPEWQPDQPGNQVRIGGDWFIVADVPHLAGKRQTVYWLLDQALVSGAFAQIRRCRSCSKFFATTRSDKASCSPQCTVKYQNQDRQDRKTAAGGQQSIDYFTQRRWEHRVAMVEKALDLKKQHWSPQAIERKTGLSENVLQKEVSGLGLIGRLETARKQGLVRW